MGANTYPLLPLESLVEIYDSKRVPVKKSDRKPGPYPYYGASGIVDYVDSYIFDGEFLLLAEDGENLRSQNLPIAFLAKGKFWANNHAHVLQGKYGNNTQFLCYALQVVDIRDYLSGSTRPKLTQRDMKRVLIHVPEPREQRAIAHILGSLDDKIELNRQMAQTLESIARAIFKSWFVDFDPVKAKMEGKQPEGMSEEVAALFPDKFVESELGMIPEGWEAKPFGELLEHHIGGGWGKEKPDEKHTLPAHVIRGTDIPGAKKGIIDNVPLRYHTASNLKSRRLHAGDIVFEVSGGSKDQPVGRALLVNEAILSALSGDTICASFCKLMRPRNETVSSFMLYLHIEEIYKNRRIMEYQTQSTGISNLKFSDFLNRDFVLVPVNGVRKAFDRHMVTLFDQMAGLGKQNWILRQIRETLLPQLISGKIRLNQPEDAAA